MNWDDVLNEVEDYLFPKMELSHRERSLYYHVLLHTRFAGKDSGIFSLPPLSITLGIAERSIREGLRVLQDKGCIRIEEISRNGHLIRAFLPSEIDGLLPTANSPLDTIDMSQPIDLGDLETITEEEPSPPSRAKSKPVEPTPPPPVQNHLNTLLAQEVGHCFFCLRKLPQEASIPVSSARGKGTNPTGQNAALACQECSNQKQGTPDDNFLRQLYRKGFLSASELEERLQVLGNLQAAKGHP